MSVYVASGFAGLQGIMYSGTNCFLRRKVIYGLSPGHDIQIGKEGLGFTNGTLSEKEIIQTFGTSRGFIESAEHALIRREDIC
ncbi:hypothetical protein AAZX31_12G181200 [Glycine max]